MIIARITVCSLLSAAAVFAAEPAGNTANRPLSKIPQQPIISSSGQFFIYASDQNWAIRFSSSADAVKSVVARLLGAEGRWRDPIVVVVHDETPPPSFRGRTQLSVRTVGDTQFVFLLHCYQPLDSKDLVQDLIEALSLEISNRATRPSPQAKTFSRMPLWWVQGVAETVKEDGSDSDQQILARAWSRAAPTPFAALVAATALPEDSLEKRYYQAQCGILVRALTATAEGRAAVNECILQTSRGRDATESFRVAFKSRFADARAMEKWWALECAARTTIARAGLMMTDETALALEQLLSFTLDVKNEKDGASASVVLRVDEILPYHERQDVRALMRERTARLRLLSTQAHPYYRWAIKCYATALEQLERGKVGAFRSSLREAQNVHAQANAYDRRVSGWMSEMESAWTPAAERFAPYLEEVGERHKVDRQRRNLIKDYLDSVEKELSR